jgi:predicted chitinase
MGNLKYLSEKFDSCLNTYRETFTDQSKIPSDSSGSIQQYDNSVILPLDFSLEMDGISGIIPNSAFEVPPEVLPKSYLTKKKESKIGFILHTIDHNFNNNKWTTKITGQTINLRFDPLSAEEIARREANKAQTSNDIIAAENAGNKDEIFPTPTAGCTKQAIGLLGKAQVVINIKLITKALNTLGITNKNAVASICAIAGGETGLIPKAEGHVYSLSNLKGVFPNLTTAQQVRATTKGITKKEFFSIVYGEYSPGRVGNRNKSDGGLYYGRGFNQLTGHGNYEATNNSLIKKFGVNVDIVKNPDKMNDVDIAAKALALFYYNKLKNVNQNDANYFKKALIATGHDANGGYKKKSEYHACLTSDYQFLI